VAMNSKPKYQIVKESIINHIRNSELNYNDPIKSEMELMEIFSVSRHTIRRAISDLVNEGWLYKHQGKGTFVANPEGIKVGKGKLIGVITTYISDYIFPEIIAGIEHTLSKEGYSILLGNTNNDLEKERQILLNMLESRLSGLIVEPTKSVFPNHNNDLYDELKKRGIPVLFIHATYQNVKASYVVEDDIHAGYKASSYLIEQGHKKIAGIFKQDDMQGHGRYEGFLKAHREAGLEVDESIVYWYTTENKQEMVESFDESKIKALLTLATGCVIYNDQVANLFIQMLGEHNIRVPDRISLVSFDNANIAQNGIVPLTTIAHPKEQLGVDAANDIMKLINKEETVIEHVFLPELIIRESVRKI